MAHDREFDIVVCGATGFTGELVAEYLQSPELPTLRWALGGRSLAKLEQVRNTLGLSPTFPLIVADSLDEVALAELTRRTRVVISTVGPYQLYGAKLIAACAKNGADYVDICGETAWMRAMIDQHERQAQASGARIVFSCGFDSIPFELGVLALQDFAIANYGSALSKVSGRVRKFAGSFSGGTLASMRASMAAAVDPAVAAAMDDPFCLTPGFRGVDQPAGDIVEHDDEMGVWLSPCVMAAINTRNVHRSNLLQDFR